jgi:cell wall-associated NlpC family hydrolase
VASTEKVKVMENNLRMRASYSTSAAIKGKLSKGTVCQLKAKTKDGKWGQISDNGYWIYLEYTEPVKEETPADPPKTDEKAVVATSEYVKITGTGLRMRASYSTDSEIKGYVTKGKVYQLKAKTADGKWGQLKSNGYWIYLDYTVAYDPSASDKVNSGDVATGVCTGQQIVDYALQFEGNPYKWGGTSLTNGTDCSGFTQSVYAHFGISLPRTTSEQAKVGRAVTYSEIKPGDIICYPGHVALYIGNDKVIHASTPTKGIIISPTSYRKDATTIRRIVE